MLGLIRVALCALSVVGASSVGWAQILPPPLAQAGESSSASVAAAPEEASGSTRTDNWFRENFSVSAGVKIWLAKWQVPLLVNLNTGSTGIISSNFSPMVGPTITGSVRLRTSEWFNSGFVNFTWLQSDGFNFDPTVATDPTGNVNVPVLFEGNRRDYTLSGGISVYKGIGIFGGYYNTQQRFSNSPLFGGGNANFRIRGPIIGVFGSSSVSERVGLYGNVAVGFLKYLAGPESGNFNAPGAQAYSSEVGLNIAGPEFGRLATTFQVGFRAQVISINTNNGLAPAAPGDQHRNDITWGPTFAFLGTF